MPRKIPTYTAEQIEVELILCSAVDKIDKSSAQMQTIARETATKMNTFGAMLEALDVEYGIAEWDNDAVFDALFDAEPRDV